MPNPVTKHQTVTYSKDKPRNMIGRCNGIWTDNLGNHCGEGEARVFHTNYLGHQTVMLGLSDRWVDDLAESGSEKVSLGGIVLTIAQAKHLADDLMEAVTRARVAAYDHEAQEADAIVQRLRDKKEQS